MPKDRGAADARPKSAEKSKAALDDLDIRMLELLQSDGRISGAEIQRAIMRTDHPVRERMANLENAGVIKQYVAVVDIELVNKLQLGLVSVVVVFSEISLRNPAVRDHFEERLRATSEVVGCWVLSGTTFDYLVQFVCADLPTYWSLTDALDAEFGLQIVTRIARSPPPKQPFGGYPLAILTGRK